MNRHRLAVVIEPDSPPEDLREEEQEDQVDFMSGVTFRRNRAVGAVPIRLSRLSRFRQSMAAIKNIGSGLLSFITLKVLFWDLPLSLADVATDFIQGVALLTTPGHETYGIVTLAISWAPPGIVAATHLVSMYRSTFPWHKTLLYALLLLAFYPLLPLLAYMNLLWKKPKLSSPDMKEFKEAEYLTVVAHAIKCGVESPIQLIFQVWLVLKGVIVLEWSQLSSFTFTDWEGNTIYLPYTASLCILFSVMSIVKAAGEFNVIKVHIQCIDSWKKLGEYILLLLDHMPFLLSASFFRIAAIIAIMTYLNTFGLVPIIFFWIFSFATGHRLFGSRLDTVPIWVVTFISWFVPVCFTIQTSYAQEMQLIQAKTFRWQSLWALLCYGSGLAACAVIVNMSLGSFKYDPDIILTNLEFNMYLAMILGAGVVSTLLSVAPKATSLLQLLCCKSQGNVNKQLLQQHQANGTCTRRGDPTVVEQSSTNVIWCLILLAIVCLPVFAPLIITTNYYTVVGPAYIYYRPTYNQTVIVQATQLSPLKGKTVQGYLKFFESTELFFLKRGLPGSNKETTDVKQYKDELGQFYQPNVPGSNNETTDVKQYKDELGQFYHPNVTQVVVISRPNWQNRKDQILQAMKPVAIVILDSEPLRPSSPLPDLLGNLQVEQMPPILLVRTEDGHHLQLSNYGFLEIWVSSTNISIIDPSWSCDLQASGAQAGGCLTAQFTTGYISGVQHRTKSCYWGGHPCTGYENQQQSVPYCNGPDIHVCPLQQSQGYSTFQVIPFGQNWRRTLRASPPHCMTSSLLYQLVDECDTGAADWTHWLNWQILTQDGQLVQRAHRRYCLNRHYSCLYEEKETMSCCLSKDNSCGGTLRHCDYTQLS